MRATWFVFPLLILTSGLLLSAASPDCSFLNNPDEFTVAKETTQMMRSDLTKHVSMAVSDAISTGSLQAPARTTRKNFTGNAIFSRIGAGKRQSTTRASDAEFLRRVTLALTGCIPSAT